MKIEIQKIEIENFKGIKALSLDFADGLCVRGDNGTGKTTIFDAVCWLLFDKDSKGTANSQIKPVDEAGAEVHNLESIVEAVFVVDGKPAKLKKSFKEKWVKKRGAASKTFEGHTTTYAVNDVPVSLKEYKAAVSEIVEEDVFKLLTNPYEFANLHWKDRRVILMQICGDVSDADVIASNEGLAGLSDILGDRSIEDAKKILAQRRKAINKELTDIPVRIQELNRAESVEQPDLERKALLNGKLIELKDRLSNETDASAIKEKELSIREISAEILEIRNSAVMDPDKAELETKVENLKSQSSQRSATLTGNKYQIDAMSREKARLDCVATDLRAQWHTENDKQFSADLACPTCGQEMPEGTIEDARSAFNIRKAGALKDITVKGKAAADESAAIGKKVAELQASNKDLAVMIKDLDSEARQCRLKLNEIQPQVDTKTIEDLETKKRVIEQEIAAIKNGSAVRRDSIKIEIEGIEEEISAISAQEAAVKADKARVERIAELEEQERALGVEFEETEGQLHTMDLFVVSKVDMLESSINSRFKLATFKMFKEQVNGGIEECCEILCGGVPFGRGLNTGSTINTGLDIINTLSNHYGIQAPIFVDNAESVTQLISTDSQMIKLIVDPESKTLTQSKE